MQQITSNLIFPNLWFYWLNFSKINEERNLCDKEIDLYTELSCKRKCWIITWLEYIEPNAQLSTRAPLFFVLNRLYIDY